MPKGASVLSSASTTLSARSEPNDNSKPTESIASNNAPTQADCINNNSSTPRVNEVQPSAELLTQQLRHRTTFGVVPRFVLAICAAVWGVHLQQERTPRSILVTLVIAVIVLLGSSSGIPWIHRVIVVMRIILLILAACVAVCVIAALGR